MTTLLLTHADCLVHDPGPGHPERSDRLRAIAAVLGAPEFDELIRQDAALAPRAAVERVHGAAYVSALEAAEPAPDAGQVMIDSSTFMSHGSIRAAYRAAGGAIQAVDAVMTGAATNAFVATRPPGHHAETHRAMGFCFFANAAIAAFHARHQHGLKRIAVVDFDVHHGNGTQEIFWSDADLFYASTHQMPLYPGTGAASETGAHGNIVNVPLHAGCGSTPFRAAYSKTIFTALRAFEPELLIISAGFDAHALDPLGGLLLETDDFTWVTQELMKIAGESCGGRVVSLLEGGYSLEGLSLSAAAHVRVLIAAGAR
jgi:acetoin utilization deacetylase AcuC-like enzyme